MATIAAGDAIINPVIQLMKDVISKEDDHQILQNDLRRMESLLQYTRIFFQHIEPLEIVKIWLQLLQNSLTEANGIFHRSRPRQSCLDCVVLNPGRISKEIRDWNAFFDHLYQGFQSDLFRHIALSGDAMISVAVDPVMELLKDVIEKEDNRHVLQIDLRRIDSLRDVSTHLFQSQKEALLEIMKTWLPLLHIVLSGNFIISQVVDPVVELLKDVIEEEDNRQILQTDLRPMESLLLDITTLFRDEPTINSPLQSQIKAFLEIMKTWLPLLQKSLIEAKDGLLDPRRLPKEIGKWSASFDKIYDGFQCDLSILVTSLQFLSPNPLHIEEKAKEPTLIQPPLSRDEGWMLFCRVAFKDEQVSTDIEDRARKIAEQCRGLPLVINVVAAAMIGQTSLHEWGICLSSLQNVDASFPAIDFGLDAQLYAALRFSYDALPNSVVKKCFLYCAMYKKDEEIDTLELVQMWIGEGLVKSKQGTYLMDMAIGRKYLKLLVDRCLFQTVKERTNVFRQKTIRVQSAIRDMAIYIGQKEENCLFMANRNQRDFPVVPVENSRRISLASNFKEDLITQLRCPELATLILKGNENLKEFPSDFLLRVASLRVLNLSGCSGISSVPTSIEELRMLQFLSLRELPIEELPKEVCRLSRLQFLDLFLCKRLKSLPSEIGEIQNLKSLNLEGCQRLEMIPREISELTSLSRLVLGEETDLSMETEAAASIWRLKGLKNMTELSVWMGTEQQVKHGIMGTWSEMRHLMLSYNFSYISDEDPPEDMKSMKKLQSFMLRSYGGYHCLPNGCKFEHLEMVSLDQCYRLTELSPLEWMPNLKLLKLYQCYALRELGIGSHGGYQRLQKLVLKWLDRLESLGGASKMEGVWDERTLPNLRVLKICACDSLQRFPVGMEKLPNLCALMGSSEWWERITFQDETMKIKLQNIFKEYYQPL